MAILKDPKTNKSVRISLCNKEKVLTFYKLFQSKMFDLKEKLSKTEDQINLFKNA